MVGNGRRSRDLHDTFDRHNLGFATLEPIPDCGGGRHLGGNIRHLGGAGHVGGAIPLDYAETEVGAREVDDLLGRIKYSVYT